MEYFSVVKRIRFSISKEARFIAIFDRPPGYCENNFNRPDKFLLHRVDWASRISKAIYIYIYMEKNWKTK